MSGDYPFGTPTKRDERDRIMDIPPIIAPPPTKPPPVVPPGKTPTK